jgi:putative transposase
VGNSATGFRRRVTAVTAVTAIDENRTNICRIGIEAKGSELCRRHGISDATFYTWRSKYGGAGDPRDAPAASAEEENRRLKSIVADQPLDIRGLKDVLARKSG